MHFASVNTSAVSTVLGPRVGKVRSRHVNRAHTSPGGVLTPSPVRRMATGRIVRSPRTKSVLVSTAAIVFLAVLLPQMVHSKRGVKETLLRASEHSYVLFAVKRDGTTLAEPVTIRSVREDNRGSLGNSWVCTLNNDIEVQCTPVKGLVDEREEVTGACYTISRRQHGRADRMEFSKDEQFSKKHFQFVGGDDEFLQLFQTAAKLICGGGLLVFDPHVYAHLGSPKTVQTLYFKLLQKLMQLQPHVVKAHSSRLVQTVREHQGNELEDLYVELLRMYVSVPMPEIDSDDMDDAQRAENKRQNAWNDELYSGLTKVLMNATADWTLQMFYAELFKAALDYGLFINRTGGSLLM